MFVDRVSIEAQAGKGGDGAVSFLRESGKPKGGPDGGDGGDGGSIILHVSSARMTLQDISHRRHYKAKPGDDGRGRNQAGRNAKDIVIVIPPGTLVFDEETGALVADLTEPESDFVLCRGGRGGRGNTSFANALNQVPRTATRGQAGQKGRYRFELKLIAEVGIVGLPNAGKSTFLARVSRATPKIAAYPFTTLYPHLGVTTELGPGRDFVLADIPGLIEGASEGKGLGDDFLRHVERTRVLLHLIDGTGGAESGGLEPLEAYRTIRAELAAYAGGDLSKKHEVVALNKVDALLPEEADARGRALSQAIGKPVHLVSGVSGQSCRDVLEALREVVDRVAREDEAAEAAKAAEAPPAI
jgi:GTP-binding protein